MKKAGIWAVSSPERIAELRQQQRQKASELDRVREQSKAPGAADQRPIDLNMAGVRELETLPAIGPVLAQRIIQGRPYQTVDDLLKVNGIGKKKLDTIRPRITVRPNSTAPIAERDQAP